MSMKHVMPVFHPHGHYFTKIKGIWTCDCGAMRDKNGKPKKPRHLKRV